jgi:hypothetical protein
MIPLNLVKQYASKVVEGLLCRRLWPGRRDGNSLQSEESELKQVAKVFGGYKLAARTSWTSRTSLVLLVVLLTCAGMAWGGDKKKRDPNTTVSYSPMPLDSGYGPMDITEPPVPPDEIVKKFTAKESVFREALNHYTYRRTVRVQTIDDDGKVDGEYYQVDDIIFTPDGKRADKVVEAPANTLQRVSMSPADFQDIEERLPFVLTTEDAGQYDIKYVGQQRVDQVECYVFDVAPKVMEKKKRYFQGKIWVDKDELQIVITNGKNVPDDLRKGHEDLSTPFTTYREEVDGENWFPTYTKGDGVLHFSGGPGYMGEDVHMRQTVKYTDYKQFGSTTKIIFAGQDISKPDENKPPDAQKPK